MKHHPRIRKTIKWGGAALTVLLVAVWIGSGWFTLSWITSGGSVVGLGEGRIAIGHMPDMYRSYSSSLPMCSGSIVPFRFDWAFEFESSSGNWYFKGSLWPLMIAGALATALAFRLDTLARRREREGECPKCHYNRTGLPPTTPCPECGTPPPTLKQTTEENRHG